MAINGLGLACCVDVNAAFIVDTSSLGSRDDIKCDDNGAWINNGVPKLYLDVREASYGN